MINKNSRGKSIDLTKSKETAEVFDSLPTLSKYNESKDLLERAIILLPIIWNFVGKIGKSPSIKESSEITRIASIEALLTGLLTGLSAIGLLTSIAFQILLFTLHTALVIACMVFISLLFIAGIDVVYKKIKSVKDSYKKKRKARRPKKA